MTAKRADKVAEASKTTFKELALDWCELPRIDILPTAKVDFEKHALQLGKVVESRSRAKRSSKSDFKSGLGRISYISYTGRHPTPQRLTPPTQPYTPGQCSNYFSILVILRLTTRAGNITAVSNVS